MTHCLRGLDVVIGAEEVVGGINIQKWQRQMNVLKQVPVGVAQILLAKGQAAIQYAQGIAAAMDRMHAWNPFVENMPGATKRAEVAGKLQWHADTLKKIAPTAAKAYEQYTSGDKKAFKKAGMTLAAPYASGEDLKKWVMQAFVEANAVEEGAERLIDAWNRMWAEIGEALAALPAAIAKQAGDVAQNLVWYLKWTYWIAIAGGVVALGFVAWGAAAGIKHRISQHSKTK